MEEHNTTSPPALGFIDDSNVSVDDSHITNDEVDRENSWISKNKEILQTIKNNNNKSKNISKGQSAGEVDQEVLIELIHNQPCLWNVNLHSYKDLVKRNNAWGQVEFIGL